MMANWKRPKKELPNDGELVIATIDDGITECVQYSDHVWEEVGSGCETFFDSGIVAWCRIPEYDLKDE